MLQAVPHSRLIARAKPFGDPQEQQHYLDTFAHRGIDPGRIQAQPYVPDPVAHLNVYDEVDIHLDSLPYSGGTTACDSLWMGVPVISLYGDRPSARLGASVLTQLGLERLVAHSADDYLRIASELAADPAALIALRGELRERFEKSSLHDAGGFTRELEGVYRCLWEEWLQAKPG